MAVTRRPPPWPGDDDWWCWYESPSQSQYTAPKVGSDPKCITPWTSGGRSGMLEGLWNQAWRRGEPWSCCWSVSHAVYKGSRISWALLWLSREAGMWGQWEPCKRRTFRLNRNSEVPPKPRQVPVPSLKHVSLSPTRDEFTHFWTPVSLSSSCPFITVDL